MKTGASWGHSAGTFYTGSVLNTDSKWDHNGHVVKNEKLPSSPTQL